MHVHDTHKKPLLQEKKTGGSACACLVDNRKDNVVQHKSSSATVQKKIKIDNGSALNKTVNAMEAQTVQYHRAPLQGKYAGKEKKSTFTGDVIQGHWGNIVGGAALGLLGGAA